jgi:hypothetical protein
MRHSKAGRIIAVSGTLCLLLALGCGMLGLAIQQGAISPRDIHEQFGPLVLITRGPRSFLCPPHNNPTENLCDRMKLAPQPAVYRVWLYWDTPGRGTQSTSMIAQWTIPVRQ